MDPLATITGQDEAEKFEVHSIADLEEALRRIAEASDPDVPPLATVLRQDGDQLTIGLGRPFSVLTYIAQDLDPPYFTSLGNENARGGEDFYLQGHHTEFRRRSLIPPEDALEAVRRFVQSKGLPLPDNIRWEEE